MLITTISVLLKSEVPLAMQATNIPNNIALIRMDLTLYRTVSLHRTQSTCGDTKSRANWRTPWNFPQLGQTSKPLLDKGASTRKYCLPIMGSSQIELHKATMNAPTRTITVG